MFQKTIHFEIKNYLAINSKLQMKEHKQNFELSSSLTQTEIIGLQS